MALMQVTYRSEVLKQDMGMTVILPQVSRRQIGMRSPRTSGTSGAGGGDGDRAEGSGFPTLYLLHGLSDDHTIWLRRTAIERYVAPLGLAVVMPNTHRGWYTDAAKGYRHWTHLSEEVPTVARRMFPLSAKREENYVAGLSMGGYGAFKLALRCPERFCAAASLSGALDMSSRILEIIEEKTRQELRDIYGSVERMQANGDDLLQVVRDLAATPAGERPRPRLWQCCGTEDFLYLMNTRFRDLIQPLGFDYHYEEGPGTHEWGYWDTKIQRVLDWLPLPIATE